jgi:hypothetical protein
MSELKDFTDIFSRVQTTVANATEETLRVELLKDILAYLRWTEVRNAMESAQLKQKQVEAYIKGDWE